MSESSNSSPKRGEYAREKGEVILREHEYDGIQEYDQKLPNWWLFTFYGAIVFTVLYWSWYYYTPRKTDHEFIVSAISQVEKNRQKELEQALASITDEKLVTTWATDPTIVSAGETTYTTLCTACHGADLSATLNAGGTKVPLPGLPLTDHQWKYGSKPLEIFKLINEGTPPSSPGHNGARMQAWGQTLAPKQIAELTAYIISKVPDDFKAYAQESK